MIQADRQYPARRSDLTKMMVPLKSHRTPMKVRGGVVMMAGQAEMARVGLGASGPLQDLAGREPCQRNPKLRSDGM
jgi:hypothetical protein